MNVGDKILELRKLRGYSQEDIANKLNVSRQTVSKWETNQSTPDFDKIVPLCQLFEISTDELLMDKPVIKKDVQRGDNKDISVNTEIINKNRRSFALGICISIFIYFLSVMAIIFFEAMDYNEELGVVVFLGLAGIATVIIVYTAIVNKNKSNTGNITDIKKENSTVKMINNILALVFLVIYLVVSFATMAFHITWILWIVYSIVCEIVNLLFKLGEDRNE